MSTEEIQPTPKRRGRKPGQGLGIKTGPRPGSRPWMLANLKVGDALYFEAPLGHSARTMGWIAADITKAEANGEFKQTHFIAIQPHTKQVIDIVQVTRVAEKAS